MNTLPNAILLIGPTGAGKTPLGEVAESRGLGEHPCRHFDFGAQLRALRQNPPASLSPDAQAIIHEVLKQGRLLEPEESFVACEIFQNWMQDLCPETIIVLNGLPRTIAQAKELEAYLTVRLVLQLAADDATILTRIHTNSGGDRTHREDDDAESIKKRLVAYRERTMPLLHHYEALGVPILQRPIDCNTDP